MPDEGRFNQAVLGTLLVRIDDDGRARVRMFPKPTHRNVQDAVHGGVTLAFIDVAMFGGGGLLTDQRVARGLTVEVSTQFLGPGDAERPLDALVEVVKETGRMVFLRGTIEQDDDMVAAFSGILRKASSGK